MTAPSALRPLGAAILVGAFALAACGGGASPAPSTASATPGATVAITPAPATDAPATAAPPSTGAGATLDPNVDPADDLEIGAPYSFAELDPAVGQMFVTMMEQSLGSMASSFNVGVREIQEKGTTAGILIVMRFPDLPIAGDALLDAVAQGASQSGGGATVEERTIAGESVRVLDAQGQEVVLYLRGDDLIMVIGSGGAKSTDITKALIDAN